jgi:hypothetical protein
MSARCPSLLVLRSLAHGIAIRLTRNGWRNKNKRAVCRFGGLDDIGNCHARPSKLDLEAQTRQKSRKDAQNLVPLRLLRVYLLCLGAYSGITEALLTDAHWKISIICFKRENEENVQHCAQACVTKDASRNETATACIRDLEMCNAPTIHF